MVDGIFPFFNTSHHLSQVRIVYFQCDYWKLEIGNDLNIYSILKRYLETVNTVRKPNATDTLSESGQRLYDESLRQLLEPEHSGEFVAIEPRTKHYFVGETGLAALRGGRRELPGRLFYLLRIGSDAVGGYGARKDSAFGSLAS